LGGGCEKAARPFPGGETALGNDLKDWRRPTLAEPIEPLPSARRCLTAEFGMGSGRATALWPPKSVMLTAEASRHGAGSKVVPFSPVVVSLGSLDC
jgi:hypothetical protein